MDDEHAHLTPDQDRLISRVQLVGVVLLVVITIGLPILDKTHAMDTWKLLGAGFAMLAVLLGLSSVLIARIEQRSTREIISRVLRESRTDLKKGLARIRTR